MFHKVRKVKLTYRKDYVSTMGGGEGQIFTGLVDFEGSGTRLWLTPK